jgi:hypothetical protein
VAAALARRATAHGGGHALRGLIALYVHYLDNHIATGAGGHHRLAGRFRRWRTRLLS